MPYVGAAMAAGCAAGIDVWDIFSEEAANVTTDIFEPNISQKGTVLFTTRHAFYHGSSFNQYNM
jgi:hypothetical protein